MLSDIEIAQAATLKPIDDIAARLNIASKDLIPYGHTIAKLSTNCLINLQKNTNGKLILVTAISPTPAGEGKTTTTIGLADALNHIFKQEKSDFIDRIVRSKTSPVLCVRTDPCSTREIDIKLDETSRRL